MYTLCNGLQQKKEEVFSKSRTVALWINYVHYIEIVQPFITAKRTSNFALRISTTMQIINLLAATAHKDYAKDLPNILAISRSIRERSSPDFQTICFWESYRPMYRYDLVWTLDRSNNRADSGEIIETEIVLNVLTKTMHRSAEAIALI